MSTDENLSAAGRAVPPALRSTRAALSSTKRSLWAMALALLARLTQKV